MLQPSGILCNVLLTKSEKDNFAQDIYKQLWSYAGRRGFEVRRTCGSSGMVDGETDKNLLFFLSYHDGILSQMARGCVILRGTHRYIVCYVKVIPSDRTDIVVWDYSRPKVGGQFEMPNPCIAKFPPIAKMINLKSHSICILNAYNYHRIKLRIPPIASGPLKFENRSLVQAKKEYSISNKEEPCYSFCLHSTVSNITVWLRILLAFTKITSNMEKRAWKIRLCSVLILIFEDPLVEVVVLLGAAMYMHCWIGDLNGKKNLS